MPKKKTPVRVTIIDSRNPGTVTIEYPDTGCQHRMTVHEAADLSERLAEGVRANGYDMVARKVAR